MSVLLVASVGGHLSELVALVDRMTADDERVWVTWPNPQSESLLRDERVEWVRAVQPRDLVGVVSVATKMSRILDRHSPTHIVTTGSALALAVAPVAALRGIPVHFIETATRAVGPSMTGRLLRRMPGVHLYAQHPGWASAPWRYGGSVFDGYAVTNRPSEPTIRKAVVTLGTMEGFSFRRLVVRLAAILPPHVEVVWQTGCTPAQDLSPAARQMVPNDELARAMADADVVIGHCGAGTALSALDAGAVPVLIPRESAHGEHVDDHQLELASELDRLGLAVTPRVDELTMAHLVAAAGVQVRRVTPPAFELVESTSHLRRRRAAIVAPAAPAAPVLTAVPACLDHGPAPERVIVDGAVVVDLRDRVVDLRDHVVADRLAGSDPARHDELDVAADGG